MRTKSRAAPATAGPTHPTSPLSPRRGTTGKTMFFPYFWATATLPLGLPSVRAALQPVLSRRRHWNGQTVARRRRGVPGWDPSDRSPASPGRCDFLSVVRRAGDGRPQALWDQVGLRVDRDGIVDRVLQARSIFSVEKSPHRVFLSEFPERLDDPGRGRTQWAGHRRCVRSCDTRTV